MGGNYSGGAEGRNWPWLNWSSPTELASQPTAVAGLLDVLSWEESLLEHICLFNVGQRSGKGHWMDRLGDRPLCVCVCVYLGPLGWARPHLPHRHPPPLPPPSWSVGLFLLLLPTCHNRKSGSLRKGREREREGGGEERRKERASEREKEKERGEPECGEVADVPSAARESALKSSFFTGSARGRSDSPFMLSQRATNSLI